MIGIDDNEFIRGDVPMTKQEIRVFDVGEGASYGEFDYRGHWRGHRLNHRRGGFNRPTRESFCRRTQT